MAAAVLFVIASIWSPANMAVLFEMRKPVPDGDVIAKLTAAGRADRAHRRQCRAALRRRRPSADSAGA